LIAAHAHILSAFAIRWTGAPLQNAAVFLFESGAVATVKQVADPNGDDR